MKFARSDLARIQTGLWLALLMLAVGAVLLYFSSQAGASARQARDFVLAQRQESDTKLKRVRDEEIEIKNKSALYARLQQLGIIGAEERLEWVELLKEIRDQRRLPDLQYEIAPQRALDGKPASGFAFYGSTMKLDLRLLHEEDLTRLLADLRSRAKALVSVRSCDLVRLPAGADERAGRRANLSASCEIDWLTADAVRRN